MPRRIARRRLVLAALLVFVLVAVFVIRLVDIQVVRAETLNEQAVDKRSIPETILGTRGDIYDSTGVMLADSVLRYDITASPKTAVASEVTPEIAADQLGPILGQNPADIVKALRDAVAADPDSDYLYIAKKVDVDAFEKIRELEIPWLYFQSQPSRTYPNGAVAGNLVGFVGSDNEPQAGLELSEDACLAGTDGSEVYERSEDGVRIPGSTVTTKQAENGDDLVLTIESDLQWYVQQTLAKYAQQYGAKWGVVVVQEVKTGKLVAVADYPTVDPNNVDAGLQEVPDGSSLGSRAFTAPFEPGSTFKTMTTASLLDAGLISPSTHVTAPYRYTTADGADVNDSEFHGTLNLTTTGMLIESSNTGMSQLGLLMSPEQRYDYMLKFGLGERTEVDFGAEATGYLGEDWDEDGIPDWDPQTNLASMFGQGITLSAVQVASIYQTIANGGVRMPVSLVAGCRLPDGTLTDAAPTEGTRVISESAARTTVDMLENVATKGWLANQVEIPGYRVAIKTGTAQQPDGNGGYSKSYLVSMAGTAPADDPQYVVSVNLADPVNMNTSGATAPIFRDVMTQVLKAHEVVPSGSSSPDLPAEF
ncbi:penicillin-binding protein 2 [Herbiconiux sp. L3-i23]|uniref:peptidoglycan D,D-transpeptidase FtsI family protein n=1 Tax=Herbiconiux sp. L3-i23 TaxID=2905871 RepID=UPI002069120B|nr:penicillin-binding protein 2 [Herbiconiux sp. L3-i23]BDI22398.1 cell division protein FtsI [Herbiconiux sp. L3-i23]